MSRPGCLRHSSTGSTLGLHRERQHHAHLHRRRPKRENSVALASSMAVEVDEHMDRVIGNNLCARLVRLCVGQGAEVGDLSLENLAVL